MFDQKKLLNFRKQKDWHWKHDKQSPLTEEQKKNFKGLNYFPPNPDLSFELELDRNVPDVGKKVVIKTTGGDEQIYLKAGKVRFNVEGKEVEALVFEDPEQEQFQYYLLFRDKTTGKETYESGRMLQIPKKGEKLVIDFNYTYNPYSSYNDNWDCPITPKENVLPVAIKAGEKNFMNENYKVLEFDQITDLIYLGTNLCCSAIPHVQILLNHDIKADIDLEEERQEETPNIDTYLWLPVQDMQAPTQQQLDTGVAVIETLVKNNKKVYIHCKNGHGRSPTLLAAYFISQGLDVDEAIEKIKSKRPQIHLQEVQIEALNTFKQGT